MERGLVEQFLKCVVLRLHEILLIYFSINP